MSKQTHNSNYSDVNEHYTDEHLIMAQADLLEQMYSKDQSLKFQIF